MHFVAAIENSVLILLVLLKKLFLNEVSSCSSQVKLEILPLTVIFFPNNRVKGLVIGDIRQK